MAKRKRRALVTVEHTRKPTRGRLDMISARSDNATSIDEFTKALQMEFGDASRKAKISRHSRGYPDRKEWYTASFAVGRDAA